MLAAFWTSLRLDPVELATRRILPLLLCVLWPFFSLELVVLVSGSSWAAAREALEGGIGGGGSGRLLVCVT